jgi:transposase
MTTTLHELQGAQANVQHKVSRRAAEIEKHLVAIEALQARGVAITQNTLIRHLGLKGSCHAAEVLTAWRMRQNEAEALQTIVVSSPSAPEASEPHADEDCMTLARYEEIVDRGFEYAWEAGEALKQIRDRRLFVRSHTTFEEYVRDRFQVHRSHAYRWIQAAEVVENLSPIGDMPKPKNESQIRPLVGLNPEHQVAAWQHACASASGPVTAKTVKASVASMFPPQRGHGETARATGSGRSSALKRVVTSESTLRQNEDSESRQPAVPNPQGPIDRLGRTGEQFAAWLANAVSSSANLVAAARQLLGTLDEIVKANGMLTSAGQDDVEVAIEFLSNLFPARQVDPP